MTLTEVPRRMPHRKPDHQHFRWMSQNTNHLPLPDDVVQSMHECIDGDEFRSYAPQLGFEALRSAILADLGLKELTAMVTDGGAAALYNICQTFLKPGDHFVTTEPGWKWPPVYARAIGASVSEILIYDPAIGYRLSAANLENEVTNLTRMIYLVDPCNPLGTCIDEEDILGISAVCRDRGIVLVHDCTYRDFADGHTLAARTYPEGTLTVYSFSKWLGMAGLRLGAVVGPEELIAQIAAAPANGLGSSVIAQRAAMAGLRVKHQWFPEVQRIQRRNQARIRTAADAIHGLHVPVYPSNGNYLVIECVEAGVDPQRLAGAMHDHGFSIRSGEYHTTLCGHRFVKVSTTVPASWVDEFCHLLPKLVDELREP